MNFLKTKGYINMNNFINTTVSIRSLTLEERLALLDQRVAERLGLLLKKAMPSRERIHQLVFLLQRETESSSQDFNSKILSYYRAPFERRTKLEFLIRLELVPSDWLHSQFILNFSTAKISDAALFQTAKYFSFQFSSAIPAPRELIDPSFFFAVMIRLVSPKAHEPKSGLRLYEFVTAWETTARSRWGARHDLFFRDLRNGLKSPIQLERYPQPKISEIWVTQTDLDWLNQIRSALEDGHSLPPYPLSRGPDLGALLQIEKLVNGYNAALMKGTKLEKLDCIHQALEKECLRLLSFWGPGQSLIDMGSVG
jgi:hypothetical protein